MEKSAKRLGWLLNELRLGTSELARRLNSHPNNISNKLRKDNVTVEFVLEIWKVLKADNININVHWVLTGEGHPFSDWVNPEFEKLRHEVQLLKQQLESCNRERDLALKLIQQFEQTLSRPPSPSSAA